MVTINYAFREISCKIVYYGPGLSGKTTNLQYVHDRIPSKSRGDLISLATEADRTLYFDFLPIHVGDIAGFATKFQLYTVPGQVFYNATRKLVLRGVDGIVFVADSQKAKMDENIESLTNMYENLRENGIDLSEIPVVIQYNKRDLPDICSIDELQKALNPEGWVCTEASAVNGTGVFDTLKRITKLVLEHTKRETAVSPDGVPQIGAASAPMPERVDVSSQRAEPVYAQTVATVPNGGSWTQANRSAVAVEEPPPPSGQGADALISSNKITQTGIAHRATPIPRDVVFARQPSRRIRSRQRSFWDRLFGWLTGR